MTREVARDLWGEDVVRHALDEPEPEPVTRELAREVKRRASSEGDPGAFARWALTLPWPRFCTVVRIVAGIYREEYLDGGA